MSVRGGKHSRGRERGSRGRGRISFDKKFNEEYSSQRCKICKRKSHRK